MSITCCFMHREAQSELIILVLQILKKLKCINGAMYMRCMDSNFLRRLRYLNTDMRGPSIANTLNADGANNPLIVNDKNPRTALIPANGNNKLSLKPDQNELDDKESARKKARKEELRAAAELKKKQSKSMSVSLMSNHNRSNSRSSTLTRNSKKCCCCVCLFGNQKNDFFVESGRQSRAFSAMKRNSLLATNTVTNGDVGQQITSTTATTSGSSDSPKVTHLQLSRKKEKSVTDFIEIHRERVSSLKFSSGASSQDGEHGLPNVVTEIDVTKTTVSNGQSSL